eukprot:TRINITY_DN18263_c0_g1_i2.p1 TRINITY_DN18263_c0_g1~~TRINITY_DN18263_c0_g1_i2.p1  ORF type:complete len:208 (+),score=70.01 TRINITY_DN18263_c0_g1_i2:83-625(+)
MPATPQAAAPLLSAGTGEIADEDPQLATSRGLGASDADQDPAQDRRRGWSRAGESAVSEERVVSGGEDADYAADDWATDPEMPLAHSERRDHAPLQPPPPSKIQDAFGTYIPAAICLAGTAMIIVGAVQLAVDSRHIVGGGRLVGFGCFFLFSGVPFLAYMIWLRVIGPCVQKEKQGTAV